MQWRPSQRSPRAQVRCSSTKQPDSEISDTSAASRTSVVMGAPWHAGRATEIASHYAKLRTGATPAYRRSPDRASEHAGSDRLRGHRYRDRREQPCERHVTALCGFARRFGHARSELDVEQLADVARHLRLHDLEDPVPTTDRGDMGRLEIRAPARPSHE